MCPFNTDRGEGLGVGAWGKCPCSGASTFYAFDSQGTSRVLTSIYGIIVDEYILKAFGEELLGGTGPVNPFWYIGQFGYYRDMPELMYVRARILEAMFGRWLSRVGWEQQMAGEHPYGYAFNNPSTYTDPSGLDPVGWDPGRPEQPNLPCKSMRPKAICYQCAYDYYFTLGLYDAACQLANRACRSHIRCDRDPAPNPIPHNAPKTPAPGALDPMKCIKPVITHPEFCQGQDAMNRFIGMVKEGRPLNVASNVAGLAFAAGGGGDDAIAACNDAAVALSRWARRLDTQSEGDVWHDCVNCCNQIMACINNVQASSILHFCESACTRAMK